MFHHKYFYLNIKHAFTDTPLYLSCIITLISNKKTNTCDRQNPRICRSHVFIKNNHIWIYFALMPILLPKLQNQMI